MKDLYSFILEARTKIGEPPFTKEDFKEYIEHCYVKGDPWDKDTDFAIARKTIEKYNEKVWLTLRGWIEGNWYQADMDEMYELISNMPMDRIDRCLGAGSNGAVIDMGDRVCKIFHKNTPMKKDDRRFYEYCMKHPNTKVFPVVYKLGKTFVIMEKLETETQKCVVYDSWLGYCPDNRVDFLVKGKKGTIEDCVKYYGKYKKEIDKAIKKLPPIGQEIFDWAVDAMHHLNKVIPGIESFLDLRLANIGERKNGEIVWFDI